MASSNANRQRGKRNERATAKRLGGKRVGIMGGEDVECGLLSLECKSRVTFVGTKWMAQCVRNAPDGKTPVVIVHTHGTRRNEDLVMVRLKDWEDMYGRVG